MAEIIPPLGWPRPPRPWFPWDEWKPSNGGGYVYLIAKGPGQPEITTLAMRACTELGIPLVVHDPLIDMGRERALHASAIIIYNAENDLGIDLVAALAQEQNIPMVFLYENNTPFNNPQIDDALHMAYDSVRDPTVIPYGYRANFGAIGFGNPLHLQVANALHDALADLFSRLHLNQVAHAHGWEWGVFAGLKETARLGEKPAPTQVILLNEWMQRHRALLEEVREKEALAYTLADELVKRGGYNLPVPVEDIVHAHGLVIERKPLHNLSARITRREGIAVIEVNESEPLTRQRFSIAHEFGHYTMIHGDLCFRMGPDEPWAYLPNEESADAFAAELLMPEALVRNAFGRVQKGGRVSLVAEAAKTLASEFQVSVSAMELRLRFLKMVP